MARPDYKKITQVLNYMAEKEGGTVNYMKAIKLLYLADRLHLRKYGRLITGDNLVAMENGTLGSQAYDIATKSDYLPHVVYQYVEDKLSRPDRYTIGKNYDIKDRLSETDLECLDKVWSVLGNKTEFQLVDFVHDLPEWQRHEYELKQVKEKKVVPLDIDDLFKPTNNLVLKNIYAQSEEELQLSHEIYDESIEQNQILEMAL